MLKVQSLKNPCCTAPGRSPCVARQAPQTNLNTGTKSRGQVIIITLQVSVDTVEALHEGKSSLLEVAQDLGVTLEPLHPNTQDPHLRRFFTVRVPNAADGKQLINILRRCQGIEAAYVKPPDELP